MNLGITLIATNKGDRDVRGFMARHYSRPKGFVGRQILYKVFLRDELVGVIGGVSATRSLPGRDAFFGGDFDLQAVVNNGFFHIEPTGDRNLGTKTLSLFRRRVVKDWRIRYGTKPIGYETLVELPRDGAVYKADNWTLVGQTKGYTCKRVAGKGTDGWTGKRVWDTVNLRPKLVFCKLNE